MAEERICGTCALSSYNNGKGVGCGLLGVYGCVRFSKWQPISKPKVQMTEEEARELFINLGISVSVEIAIEEARKHGYIRKSELVELVEEVDSMKKIKFENLYDWKPIKKLFDCIDALKKDHPEFGGKK